LFAARRSSFANFKRTTALFPVDLIPTQLLAHQSGNQLVYKKSTKAPQTVGKLGKQLLEFIMLDESLTRSLFLQ